MTVVQLHPAHAIDPHRLAALADVASNFAAALAELVASEAAMREAREVVAEAAEAGFDISDAIADAASADPALRARLIQIAAAIADEAEAVLR